MCQVTTQRAGNMSLVQGAADGTRSVLGELQQNGAAPAARHAEGFDSWAARKQLQTRVETLQAKVKVRHGTSWDVRLMDHAESMH